MTPLEVSLIGVPTDIGAGTPGARLGPDALRVAGIGEAIARFGNVVRDLGNLTGPANPNLPPTYQVLSWGAAWAVDIINPITAAAIAVLFIILRLFSSYPFWHPPVKGRTTRPSLVLNRGMAPRHCGKHATT